MHRWRDRLRAWRSTATLAAFATLSLAATPSQAGWLRAESPRFVVYSDGSEAALRQYVLKLEAYDRVLAAYTGLSTEADPPRKLPIYIVSNHAGLAEVWPDLSPLIAGFYTRDGEDIFAMADRSAGGDDTILHEYAHHFMLQHFSAPYPAWFVEGFAEYFMTAQILPQRVSIGKPNEERVNDLVGSQWMRISDLLGTRYGEVNRRSDTYYPLSWLLAHWFLGDATRKAQLAVYLRELSHGVESVQAMQDATGLDPSGLEQALRLYVRRGVPYSTLSQPLPVVDIAVSHLPPSADTLLLLNQRLFHGVDKDDRATVLAEVRAAVARYPSDAFAQLVLGHAQVILGDRVAGEATLTDVLTREPDNVRALQFMARARMDQADGKDIDADTAAQLQRQARGFLGRAYQADDANFTTLLMLTESRAHSSDYPNENDVATMRLAFDLVPQLPSARMNLAQALIDRGDKTQGIALLRPLTNSPHDPEIAAYAQRLIDRANGVASEPTDTAAPDDTAPGETGSPDAPS